MSLLPRPKIEDEEYFAPYIKMTPANEVLEWVNTEILSIDGNLYNEDHIHLKDADLCFMWASHGFTKAGKAVLGQAEQVMFMAGGWKGARAEQQMYEWFDRVPKFIITLSKEYCAECSDVEFCALVEHELYHIVQKLDEFGCPKFSKETGLPLLEIKGHDVEEFSAVVKRYGSYDSVNEMVNAAQSAQEVQNEAIIKACRAPDNI